MSESVKSTRQNAYSWQERIELLSKLGQSIGALQGLRFQVDESCRGRIDKLLEDIGDPSVLWRDGDYALGVSPPNPFPSEAAEQEKKEDL